MPRPNPPRSLQSEDNLAHRIAYERERRGWTYEGTAKRMTDAGCPLQGSAIYKIEKGNPRRRISVDELVAFAEIFDFENLSELLIPVGQAATMDAFKLMIELQNKFKVLFEAAEDYYGTLAYILHDFHYWSGRVSDEMGAVSGVFPTLVRMLGQINALTEKNRTELRNVLIEWSGRSEEELRTWFRDNPDSDGEQQLRKWWHENREVTHGEYPETP